MSIHRWGGGLVSGFALVAVSTVAAHGAIITVRADGTGDYATVADAVSRSFAGDEIEIGPGSYPEPSMIVAHSLTIRSTDGPAVTTISGMNDHRIFRFEGPGTFVVKGLRFIESYNPNIGAVAFVSGAQAVVDDCVFEDNYYGGAVVAGGANLRIAHSTFLANATPASGGALYVSGAGTEAIVEVCLFESNAATGSGGAISAAAGGHVEVAGSTFRENNGGGNGGAIQCLATSSIDVHDSVFISNVAFTGAAIHYNRAVFSEIERNTFHANISVNPQGATVFLEGSLVTFSRNIVTGDPFGAGLGIFRAVVRHECNIYWQNDGGTLRNTDPSPSERELDPVYCDPQAGDFTVSVLGPAAPAQSPCGEVVGALPAACSIEPPPPPPMDAPVITEIDDVPNDQGRQVRIRFNASRKDSMASSPRVTGYAVYRHEGMIMTAAPAASRAPGGAAIEDWDFLVTVPARGDGVYQTVVATTCDSTVRDGLCQNAFFVSAVTDDPDVFYDSAPDTGYSVDNLPPEPPENLLVAMVAQGNALTWRAGEGDVVEYAVYSGATADFVCTPDNRVAVVSSTEWVDPEQSARYYKVTAVDASGNESAPSSPVQVTGAGGVRPAFTLDQNVPNPFNPLTRIRYSLAAEGGRVTLRIFDVSGRHVRTLLDAPARPGSDEVVWDGRDDAGASAASGVYFYRLRAPGFERTRKMTLIR